MTPPTRVSVLLPVRNGLPHLRAALRSVLAQSFTAIEVILIDDGSVDGSGRVGLDSGDARVRVIPGGGLGIAHALNLGLAAATGEFIARQDADDLSAPDRFARLARYLDDHPEVAVVASQVDFIDDAGRPVHTPWTRAVAAQWDRARTPEEIGTLMPLTCCLVHGSVMARRSVLMARGGYDERLPVAQDYDLWLRLLPEHRFAKLDECLYSFRIHSKQISASHGSVQAEHAVTAKLRYLERVAPVPAAARVRIFGAGTGADIYRRALAASRWALAGPRERWDVAVFTDFNRLDADMHDAAAHEARPLRRIANFLVAGDSIGVVS
ncbi:MAG: glycosyltransferase [Vicinamibacterales bacterium]